jgi:1-deoxy-D-xylulose-5-phosphate synthase
MEENVASGGFGERVQHCLMAAGQGAKVLGIALPDDYIEHGKVEVLKKEGGIDTESVVRRIKRAM